MKKLSLYLPVIAIIAAFSINFVDVNDAEEEVKEVILKGYVHGAFNALNPEEMRNTFHEDFAIFSTDGENLRKYPIDVWADNVERRLTHPEFDADDNAWEHNFVSVDVSGNSAAVKLELFRNGELVYTDYLSLLKFNDGWKIVAKVYHQHT